MEAGSIVVLSKRVPKGDIGLGASLGHDIPKVNEYYTVSEKGVFMMYCHLLKMRLPTIMLEELVGTYDPWFFEEVQKPMNIDIEKLLSI